MVGSFWGDYALPPFGPSLFHVSGKAGRRYRKVCVVNAVADKLREARALIERGWTQERFDTECEGVTHYCTVGAMLVVSKGRHFGMAAAFKQVIGGQNIYNWNDAPERTQAEVLAAFDKAIDLAEAGQ